LSNRRTDSGFFGCQSVGDGATYVCRGPDPWSDTHRDGGKRATSDVPDMQWIMHAVPCSGSTRHGPVGHVDPGTPRPHAQAHPPPHARRSSAHDPPARLPRQSNNHILFLLRSALSQARSRTPRSSGTGLPAGRRQVSIDLQPAAHNSALPQPRRWQLPHTPGNFTTTVLAALTLPTGASGSSAPLAGPGAAWPIYDSQRPLLQFRPELHPRPWDRGVSTRTRLARRWPSALSLRPWCSIWPAAAATRLSRLRRSDRVERERCSTEAAGCSGRFGFDFGHSVPG